jgi:hypothetical protein
VSVPVSIQRIAPLPTITVEILNRIPSLPDAVDAGFNELLKSEPQLQESTIQLANQHGFPDLHAPDLAQIALSVLLRQYMQRAFDVSEDFRYWRYTLACAFTCQELARFDNITGLQAYAAGLLHDIGRLGLIAAYPEKYANLLTLTNSMFESGRPFDISEYERMLFGLDRFATGGWLAGTWRLPAWLRPVVGKFTDRPTEADRRLIDMVRSGTQLAHSLGFGYLEAAPRMSVREILSKHPAALHHWGALDRFQLGEKAWRASIEPRLTWY